MEEKLWDRKRVVDVSYGSENVIAFLTPWGVRGVGLLVAPTFSHIGEPERGNVMWGLQVGEVDSPHSKMSPVNPKRFRHIVYALYDAEQLKVLDNADEQLAVLEMELTEKQLEVASMRKRRLEVYAKVCKEHCRGVAPRDMANLKEVAVGMGSDVAIRWKAGDE